LNTQLVCTFKIPLPRDSGSNLLSTLRVPYLLENGGGTLGLSPLRERGRDSPPKQTNVEGPRILRTEHGRIPRQ